MDVCVMIVDDDQIFNLMARLQLVNAGISARPYTFTDGKEALLFIAEHSHSDTPILLFLDINMPRVSGWQVLDQLEQISIRRKIHVVIVTSSIDSADQRRAESYGRVVGYFIKPLKYEQVLSLKRITALSELFISP